MAQLEAAKQHWNRVAESSVGHKSKKTLHAADVHSDPGRTLKKFKHVSRAPNMKMKASPQGKAPFAIKVMALPHNLTTFKCEKSSQVQCYVSDAVGCLLLLLLLLVVVVVGCACCGGRSPPCPLVILGP